MSHTIEPGTAQRDIVIVICRNEAICAECGINVGSGNLLRVEDKGVLCLDCADLGHLEFLPRGDTAVPRRATKYSELRAAVVKWSRHRKRYERQGILATPEAIERAEQESLADEELRKRRQLRAAVKRDEQDQVFLKSLEAAIRQQFPSCPPPSAAMIANHACEKYSGRVGRSAAAKQFDPQAVRLAVVAHIRHAHTRYDSMLARQYDRYEARQIVQPDIDKVLNRWSGVTD